MKASLTLSSLCILISCSTLVQSQEESETARTSLTLSEQALIENLRNLTDQSKKHPTAVEIIEEATASNNSAVKATLEQYNSDVEKLNPLAKWLPALHGGDPEKGKLLFLNHPQAQCSTCHQSADKNNQIGPDLTGLATRFNNLRSDLLEALVIPSAFIAEGYGTVTVEFEKGLISGKFLAYQATGVVVEIDGEARLISHSDYRNLNFQKSVMPKAQDSLSLREIRDLVAYLATLKGKPNTSTVDNIKTTPFSLTELTETDLKKEVDITEKQKRLYLTSCAACHGANGEGNETFPPLAQSEWVSGDKETLIKIQLLGLQGPIKVRGKVYDNGVPMPSNAHISNEDLAHILSYIRTDSAFRNNASIITSEEIVEARATFAEETEVLDASTLTHPDLLDQEPTPQKTLQKAQDNESTSYLAYLIGFIILCFIPVVMAYRKNNKPTT